MRWTGILGLLLALLQNGNSIPLQDAAPLTVWTAPSLQRVGLSDPPANSPDLHIWAARGECESFQIVVRASSSRDLTNSNVITTPFTNGQVALPVNAVQLFREHYVGVYPASPDWGGTNRSRGVGRYADGLIPFPPRQNANASPNLRATPFSVAAGQNQPVWADVCVPPSASAGDYRSVYTVSTDEGNATGAITLTVWNFNLPKRPSLKSSIALWREDTDVSTYRELLRHKLEPLYVNTTAEEQRILVDEFGLRQVNLGLWSGAEGHSCQMQPAPALSSVLELKNQFLPQLSLFNFTADEIDRCGAALYPRMREWARVLHAAGIKNLVSITPTTDLFDDGTGTDRSVVDIWVVLPKMYDQATDAVAQARGKGDEVWSTNAVVQDGYSPKWMIDYDPINFRIQPGFMSQALRLTGLLYWRADNWGPHPWNNVNNTGVFGPGNYPGEGSLLYPGNDIGVDGAVASMRLKWLRDGVDDYEYVQLLKAAGRSKTAFGIVNRVARTWSDWSQDPDLLLRTRNEMGQLLNDSR